MKQLKEIDFMPQVEDAITNLGYKLTAEPTQFPNQRLWLEDPLSLLRGPKYRPDFLVERDGKYAIVEVKSRLFLLEGVIQARKYADYTGLDVVICVPDELLEEIPGSVIDFADYLDVRLSALSEVDGVLKDLLD